MFERTPTAVPTANASRRPRIVIVGPGFGGLAVKTPPAPFCHRNLGKLAPIGRKEAVVDHGWIKVTGMRRTGIAALVTQVADQRSGARPRDLRLSGAGPGDRDQRSLGGGERMAPPHTLAKSPVLRPGLKDDTEAAATGRGCRD